MFGKNNESHICIFKTNNNCANYQTKKIFDLTFLKIVAIHYLILLLNN